MKPSSEREIGIALLGFGHVGQGTLRILSSHARDIERRLGARVNVRHVLVRSSAKARNLQVDPSLITEDEERVFADPGVSVVVELIGGTTHACRFVERAINSGRHVVTANKALLADFGEKLFAQASEKGVDLHFEGAVCGGIPIIRTIREALASDRIEGLFGIMNGTTNFILSSMAEQGKTYEEALSQAQALGFAEADPTFDVSGMDACQKLALLTSLAFMARIQTSQIFVEGIEDLRAIDFAMAREFGFVLKLLASARRLDSGALDVRVHPAFLPQQSPLAKVHGAFNAVLLQSAALGPSLLYGQGAGALPTGSAVVSDIIDVCRNLLAKDSGRLPLPCPPWVADVRLQPAELRKGPYYLRFSVKDEPGVLGRIASVLGERGVSIASVIQRQPRTEENTANIVVFTHEALERDVCEAVKRVNAHPATCATTQLIRIETQAPVG